MRTLAHQLDVHQSELELQNEELRATRQLTEAALERYTEVFDFAPIGYATVGHDGTIREINHAGAKLLGTERGRLVARRFLMFIARGCWKQFDELLADVRHGIASARCEVEIQRGDELIPVRISAGALRHGDAGVMLAFEDITERRAKEAELLRTEAALRVANARKDDFLAMLSHELRNPLAPIRTSISVLQLAEAGSEAALSALAILDRSTSHLTRLVDDLLDATRIARGKFELQRSLVDLRDLVRDSVEDFRRAFADRELKIHMTLGNREAWVFADPARISQVMSNVLGNAEKFTPRGGRIDIVLAADERLTRIDVRDSGIGIAADVIGTVFDPFAQAPQALDRQKGGLGLGLAMVKAIVELHAGRAEIHSGGLGRGTEVIITLPTAQPRVSSGAREPREAKRGRKVLIVEDKRDTAEALRFALTLKGHTVLIAYDGRSAVKLASEFSPDVVVCDLGLPDIDGYQVARELRRNNIGHPLCLVALSGYARPEDVARARDAGFDRHIAKPPRLEELDHLIAAVP